MKAKSDTDPHVRKYRAQIEALQRLAEVDTLPEEDTLPGEDEPAQETQKETR